MSDILVYFGVKCSNSFEDILCGELLSEVVACLYFVFDVSVESGVIVFSSACRYVCFVCVCNYVGEVLCCLVDVVVVCNTE